MLFDAFSLGERGTLLYHMACMQLHMACVLAHPELGKTVITMKNTTRSKENVTF